MDEKLVKIGDYIVVSQLPVIEDSLSELHVQIQADMDAVRNLAATEENYKELKKIRADWNKRISVLEELRKKVKAEIEEPYRKFEKGPYNALISEMRGAVNQLDTGIKDVEEILKMERQKELFAFFEDYRTSLGLDSKIADPRRSGIEIGLSGTVSGLKKRYKEWLDKVDSDLKTIETLENRDEIMAEYRITLDLGKSIQVVKERIARAEEERQFREERLKIIEKEQSVASAVAEIGEEFAPVPVVEIDTEDEDVFGVSLLGYDVWGTGNQLKALKNFLKHKLVEFCGQENMMFELNEDGVA